ncbi:hypothetical protein Bca52824_086110 [Brassica carinata]|uniref:Uncharacterized protein n=1 Tax=Brassica carinata TaxID=52824 RepID=A0A8X7TLP5_BRACI|nr:hypothetical protein Bca52824_086110 [Brassica carinata]
MIWVHDRSVGEGEATRAQRVEVSPSRAILRATSIPSILSIKSPSESLVERSEDFNSIWGFVLGLQIEKGFDFLVKIDKLVRSRMDPVTEIRETKRKKEYINMLISVADSKQGFRRGVPVADGLHYRQPWVIGVEEHIERLTRRVEEVEGEVQALTQEVDSLTGQFYNLSVQVADLEKLCFD